MLNSLPGVLCHFISADFPALVAESCLIKNLTNSFVA